MHVIIENTVALNTGDAAILLAIVDIVRETFGAETRITVYDSAPDVAARHYPRLEFRPLVTSFLSGAIGGVRRHPLRRLVARLQRRAFRRAIDDTLAGRAVRPSALLAQEVIDGISTYRSADLVISTGGTYLVEHYKLRNRFEELHKDLLLQRPLVLFTQSLGPFKNPENRAEMKAIASRAALVLLRDEKSRQHLRDIGVDSERLVVVADSVFALARRDWILAPPPGGRARGPRVAVSVRRWTHFDGRDRATATAIYEAAVAGAVTALVRERGAEVVFLSTCQGIPEYLYDDSDIADRICATLDPDVRGHVSIDRGFHDPDSLMDTLRGFDFAVSTRMHMAIMGLCVGLPVLPIAYEFKTTELYRALGQEDWVTDISRIDRHEFPRMALRFADHFGEFRRAVGPRVLEHASSARSAGPLMARALGRASGARC